MIQLDRDRQRWLIIDKIHKGNSLCRVVGKIKKQGPRWFYSGTGDTAECSRRGNISRTKQQSCAVTGTEVRGVQREMFREALAVPENRRKFMAAMV